MNESKAGIVYFLLEHETALESLTNKTILSMYSSFAKFLTMSFLIKTTEGKSHTPRLSKNVKTMTWIP